MPSLDVAQAGRRRAGRTAVTIAGVAATLLVSLYVALPWLVGSIVPRFSDALGVDQLAVKVGRPGLGAVAVQALELSSGRIRLSARDGVVSYHPGALLEGRVDAVRFRTVSVRMEAQAAEAEQAPDQPAVADVLPDPARLLAGLPASRVAVETLILEVPEVHFRGTGALQLAPDLLEMHLRGLAPARAEPFTMDVRIGADGVVDVRVAERGVGERPVLALTSELGGDHLDLSGELALEGFALDLAAAMAGLEPGAGAVEGRFSAHLPWPLPDPWQTAVSARGDVTAGWRPGSGEWEISGSRASWQLQAGRLSGDLEGSFGLEQQAFDFRAGVSELPLDGRTGTGTLAVTSGAAGPLLDVSWMLTRDMVEMEGDFELHGAMFDLAVARAGLPPGRGTVTGQVSTRLPRSLPERWQQLRPPTRLTFRGEWQPDEGEVQLSGVAGELSLDDDVLSGTLDATFGYHGVQADAGLRLERVTLEHPRVAARGRLLLGSGAELPFAAGYHLVSGQGDVSAQGELVVAGALADELVDGWQQPFDLSAGRIAVAADLQWPAAALPTGTLTLGLDDLAGHYEDYVASGLSGHLELASGEDGTWSLAPARIDVARVDTGVVLSDLETAVAWSGDTVEIRSTTASLLGGSARADAFRYHLAAGSADFVVELVDLSLGRILALEGEHISGSGVVNGTLPVSLRDNALSVADGGIRSEPPGGVISVSPALAGGTGQPGLDFALRALEDFRYQVLTADVTYSASGDLSLAVRLEGSNPEIQGGRPIHYNVNVNENIPTLLKSLRLQDELTRQIERGITD